VFAIEIRTGTELITVAVLTLGATLALNELYGMARAGGFRPFLKVGLVLGIVLLLCPWAGNEGSSFGALPIIKDLPFELKPVLILCVLLISMWARSLDVATLHDAGITLLGLFYVPFLLSFAIRIRMWPADGIYLLVLLILITEGGDIPAFLVGSRLGRRRIAPRISPAKMLEGALAQIAFGIIVTVAFVRLGIAGATPAYVLYVYGFTITGISLLSDLSESLIKRCLKFKDSGAGLSSYGGILDRLDCLLFTAPAGYIVLVLSAALH
jgi:phosphatidate cytidylyltransferase